MLPWCVDCGRAFLYPREVCPLCLGIGHRVASGHRGAAWSTLSPSSTAPPPVGVFGEEPYVIALVDLDEGVRMMTNVVGCPPDDVEVGMAVEVTWEPMSDGRQLPLFEPSPGRTTP